MAARPPQDAQLPGGPRSAASRGVCRGVHPEFREEHGSPSPGGDRLLRRGGRQGLRGDARPQGGAGGGSGHPRRTGGRPRLRRGGREGGPARRRPAAPPGGGAAGAYGGSRRRLHPPHPPDQAGPRRRDGGAPGEAIARVSAAGSLAGPQRRAAQPIRPHPGAASGRARRPAPFLPADRGRVALAPAPARARRHPRRRDGPGQDPPGPGAAARGRRGRLARRLPGIPPRKLAPGGGEVHPRPSRPGPPRGGPARGRRGVFALRPRDHELRHAGPRRGGLRRAGVRLRGRRRGAAHQEPPFAERPDAARPAVPGAVPPHRDARGEFPGRPALAPRFHPAGIPRDAPGRCAPRRAGLGRRAPARPGRSLHPAPDEGSRGAGAARKAGAGRLVRTRAGPGRAVPLDPAAGGEANSSTSRRRAPAKPASGWPPSPSSCA